MGSCMSHHLKDQEHHFYHHHPSAVVDGTPPKLIDFIPVEIFHSVSKDESFFDAEARFESESEEDFYSIEGDYTSARFDTSILRRFSTGTLVLTPYGDNGSPRLVKAKSTPSHTSTTLHVNSPAVPLQFNVVADKELAGCTHEISECIKRKKLFELFRLSRGRFAHQHILVDKNSTVAKIFPESVSTSVTSSTFISTATSVYSSSATTSDASSKRSRNKSLRLVHPTACLKLLKVRHKNEKGLDVNTISEQGRKSEGNKSEV